MKNLRIIARLDLNNENLVKGKLLEGLRQLGPVRDFTSKYYNQGADEIIFLDSVASLYKRDSLSDVIRSAVSDIFIPLIIGGGIRTLNDIEIALRSGADKVAINSEGIRNKIFISEAVRVFGSQAIVGSVVVRRHRYDWECFIDNARHRSQIFVMERIKTLIDQGVGEIMLTSIDHDGLMTGGDIELIKKINSICKIPIIYSGGISNADQIIKMNSFSSIDAYAIGSSVHYGLETFTSIKTDLKRKGLSVRL